jgi:phage-related holin
LWKNFKTKTGGKTANNNVNKKSDLFATYNQKKMKYFETLKTFPETTEFTETISSVFAFNLKAPVLVWFAGFSIGTINGFVEIWLFGSAVSFYALIALIFADHISGVLLAWKRNDFQTRKFLRIFWTLLSHVALLYFATQLSKGATSLFWLNEAVFVPLVLVNLLSLVKNLSLLGYIKKSFASLLYKKIDVHKNNFIKKDKIEE